jgi:accessory gene regulator protein AgrB
MTNLSCAIFFVVWAFVQIINGNYGFAIADFILAGLNILIYLIDRNEKVKEAFEMFEEIFFETYGKDKKK